MAVDASEVLDVIGGLVAQFKAYSVKVPAVLHMTVVPGGLRPSPEAVEAYEKAVYRFRDQATAPAFRRLNELFIESLEAFESGLILRGVQSLLMALDQLELMRAEQAVRLSPPLEARLKEYRTALHRIMPGNKPELDGAGKGLQ